MLTVRSVSKRHAVTASLRIISVTHQGQGMRSSRNHRKRRIGGLTYGFYILMKI